MWGLLRSAQAEHPGRLVLVDADPLAAEPGETDWLAAVLASGGAQYAVRAGTLRVPRLVRAGLAEGPGTSESLSLGMGTVLVTGATGTLGGVVSRHLVVGARGPGPALAVPQAARPRPAPRSLLAELEVPPEPPLRLVACDLSRSGPHSKMCWPTFRSAPSFTPPACSMTGC